MQPTTEQTHALELFRTGDPLVVQARAGTGKTSTLRLMAAATRQRGQYMAFNRAIVDEAGRKFPDHVGCNTAHSLAFRAIGRQYAHRLNSGRQRSQEIAARLGLDELWVVAPGGRKRLAPGYLAGHVMRAIGRFCQSTDPEPTSAHFTYIQGIDAPAGDGRQGWANQREVGLHCLPALRRAWADIQDLDGELRFEHSHYLKLWQLQEPRIPAEFVLFDEAQDASPVMLSIVEQQADHAQLIYVGDDCQEIYGWNGAINALGTLRAAGAAEATLSQSFRFGPAIAAVANIPLAMLGATPLVAGAPSIRSAVGEVERPHAVLTRTNARSVSTFLMALAAGERPYLAGGGTEVASFARAAIHLATDGWTAHPELACFRSWGEVQEYCLAPGSRVLTPDLSWTNIERLVAGDQVVAFDEECAPGNGGRRYRTADVESVRHIERPARRVWMHDGTEVVASVDHRWLVKSGTSLRWKATEWLRPGDEIASIGQPWEPDESRDGGWLAGLFDGEGWVGRRGLAVAQKEGLVLDRARRALKERGFEFGETRDESGVVHMTISGSMSDRLRLLGTLRPDRLLSEAETVWDGMRVEARQRSIVRGVEDVGEQHVVAVQTTARTFIAEGLLSHNCEQDPQGSELRLMVALIDEFGAERILEGLSQMPRPGEASTVVSTAHKAKGCEWPTVQLADDFPGRPETEDEPPPEDEELRLLYVAVTRAQQVLDVTRCSLLADEREEVAA